MSRPDICIHHHPCADGFAAAWAIWKRWPGIDFQPGVYGQSPPDVAGKHVLIVDFSYKREVLEAMGRIARTITVLDHHKSAEADLAAFRMQDLRALDPADDLEANAAFHGVPPIQAWFDMDQSGAMMAWQYAHGAAPAPMLVRFVQDRDLWRFDMAGCREVAAELFSRPYDFDEWSIMAARLESETGRQSVIEAGAAIERKHHKDVAELLRLCTRSMLIGGHHVPVANIPYTLSSDAANALAQNQPFGACYYDNAQGQRVFSLRSQAYGVDVSQIAVGYGGGGHARAAGFTVPRGWEGDAPGASA